MKIRKKIALSIAVLLIVFFAVWNIIWFVNYNSMKKNFSAIDYNMEKEDVGNEGYYYETEDYIYRYVLPKYLYFNTLVQVVGSYRLSERVDGSITNNKKYHASIVLNIDLLKGRELYIEIDEANDENGKFIEQGCAERLDLNPDFSIKKIYFGISDKDESAVKQLYDDAIDEVNLISQEAVDFFGDEIFK